MALTLFTPTGAVTEMPFDAPGPTIIGVRCADYVGPARGTLSVVSDALSLAGDVVRDTQSIPVQTTNTSIATQFGDAALADSVRITVADLPLDPTVRYAVYASSRQEGDPPTNARSRMTWMHYGNHEADGTAGFWAWGIQTGSGSGYISNPFRYLARPVVPNYIIYFAGGVWARGSETYIKLRSWGIDGGDQATYFDMVYFVPERDLPSNPGNWLAADFLINGGDMPLRFGINGTLIQDHDNDDTSITWEDGLKFSVMKWWDPFVPQGIGGLEDYQENDDEPSMVDVNSAGGAWNTAGTQPWEVVDPKSSLAYISGTTHIVEDTIVAETFPSFVRRKPSTPTIGNWGFIGALGGAGLWGYNSSEGWVVIGQHSSFTFDDSETYFPRYWDPDVSGVFRYVAPAGEVNNWKHSIVWGNETRNQSSYFSETLTDPRTHHATIRFKNATLMAKGEFDVVQESYFEVGTVKTALVTAGGSFFNHNVLASLALDSSGDLELSIYCDVSGTDATDNVVLASPVSVGSGYTAGDEWWVKVDKRLYHYRAKAWKDGDTEPDWQVEAFEPILKNETAGVETVLYEWDDNWLGDVTNDAVLAGPTDSEQLFHSWYNPQVRAGVGNGMAAMNIDCSAMEVTHSPGDGDPGDVTTKTVKYDGSVVLDEEVTIPYGSHYWVYNPETLNRHFFAVGGSAATFDIWAWKEAGFPPLTPAILSRVWERRLHKRRRPQIYRRPLG